MDTISSFIFPDGAFYMDAKPEWKQVINSGFDAIFFVLTFPFGCLCEVLLRSVHMRSCLDPLYVPLNAYLWGFVGNKLFMRRRVSQQDEKVSHL